MTSMRTHRALLKAPIQQHARSQKGNAIVEFALILPLFLLLFMGMITFFLGLYDKTVLTMATREGARAGAVASSDQITKAETAGNLACSGKIISFGSIPATLVTATTSGDNIIVTASFTYVGLDFLGLYTSGFPISATTTMMLESP